MRLAATAGAVVLLPGRRVCLGDAVTDLPVMAGSSFAWIAVLAGERASSASVVAGIGLIGLFPTGVPDRRGERLVLHTAALTAVLLMLFQPDTAEGLVPAGRTGDHQPAFPAPARLITGPCGDNG